MEIVRDFRVKIARFLPLSRALEDGVSCMDWERSSGAYLDGNLEISPGSYDL